MDRAVIKAMAAFVYLAVLKDALICLVMKWQYEDEGMDLFMSSTKMSGKSVMILEGYQNIRKFSNIMSTKISGIAGKNSMLKITRR